MSTMHLGTSVVADVRSYLEFLAERGQGELPVKPAVMAALAACASRAAVRTPARPAAPTDARVVPAPEPVVGAPAAAVVSAGAQTESHTDSDSLDRVAGEVAACTACKLHTQRTQVVTGQGNARHPDIMFVGEAPGYEEDQQGLAFVGRAGALLTKMIEAMGYSRDEVFIANICKCRPPENRTPTLMEMTACLPYLKRQIALVQPRVIVALGGTAVNGLVDLPPGAGGITRIRGKWLSFEGIDLMPTFHPAYLLRTPKAKRPAWEDLKTVLSKLGRTPPVT